MENTSEPLQAGVQQMEVPLLRLPESLLGKIFSAAGRVSLGLCVSKQLMRGLFANAPMISLDILRPNLLKKFHSSVNFQLSLDVMGDPDQDCLRALPFLSKTNGRLAKLRLEDSDCERHPFYRGPRGGGIDRYLLAPGSLEPASLGAHLRSLSLYWIHLGDTGMAMLTESLSSCTALTHLGLEHCNVGDALALANLLDSLTEAPRSPTLTDLRLCGNLLSEGDVSMLADSISQFPLEYLDLSDNDCFRFGAGELADGVLHPLRRSLKTLKLGSLPSGMEWYDTDGKCLHRQGVKILAPVLAQCELLTDLDLSGNGMTTRALMYLEDTLPCCSQLKRLNLSRNGISEEDVADLRAACSAALKSTARSAEFVLEVQDDYTAYGNDDDLDETSEQILSDSEDDEGGAWGSVWASDDGSVETGDSASEESNVSSSSLSDVEAMKEPEEEEK